MTSRNELGLNQFIEKYVQSLAFLSEKEKKKALVRAQMLQFVFSQVRQYSGIKSVDDLPRQEYLGALQRFVCGFFDDSIYHSCLSVEMALLVRLNAVMPPQQKQEIHDTINAKNVKPSPFTFGSIYAKCKSREFAIVKGDESVKRIDQLIEKRNLYIHASNFISGLIITLKEKTVPEIDRVLKQLKEIENQSIIGRIAKMNYTGLPSIKKYLTEQKQLIESIPDFSWCSKDRHREEAQQSVEEFITKLEKMKETKVDTSTNYKRIMSAAKLRGSVNDIIEESFLKDESYEILNDSLVILKDLKFF